MIFSSFNSSLAKVLRCYYQIHVSHVCNVVITAGRTLCVVAAPDEGMAPWLLAVIIVLSAVFIISTIFITVCLVNYFRKRKGKQKKTSVEFFI